MTPRRRKRRVPKRLLRKLQAAKAVLANTTIDELRARHRRC
jgi:hypothetical protein